MTAGGRGRWWWALAALPIVTFGVLVRAGGAPFVGRRPPTAHVVEIRGMAFHPAVLEVARGDTVVWINRDMYAHTATATGARGWDTGMLTEGQEAREVVRRAGTTRYICTLHATMEGTLTVR